MMHHYAISSYAIKLDIPRLRVTKPRRYWRDIVSAVAEAFEVSAEGILSTSRDRCFSWPRQAAYLLLHEERGFGPSAIGRHMKRNHCTVHVGIEAARNRLESDPEFAAAYRKARRG